MAGAAVAVPLTAATITSRGSLGTVLLAHVQLAATVAGSGGLYAGQDRMTIVRGRRADPARADEVVATPDAAAALRLHPGSRVRVALISNTGGGPPGARLSRSSGSGCSTPRSSRTPWTPAGPAS